MKFDHMTCAEHLAEMVRFKTVSDVDPDKMDYDEFYRFHQYLEQRFPLLHKTLSREVVGRAGLLYKWTGTGKSGNLPIMLTAHQDVVPAGDESRWTYPPYGGTIADGRVWGRGANDCKGVMLAHLEAIEALIAGGFVPDYDVYLGYGCNEEVGGSNAAEISALLQSRGVRLGMLIDEGSGVCPGKREGMCDDIVYIKLAEKGGASYKIIVRGKGGHTMNMGKKGLIAEMGQIIVDLQKTPFPWRLTDCVAAEYREKAPYFLNNQEVFSDLEHRLTEACELLEKNPREIGKFYTTRILTGIHSISSAGSMPTEVELTVSCALLDGDTAETVREELQQIVGDRAEVQLMSGRDPSPTSRMDTAAYRCVKEAYERLYPGVHVIPSLGVGGTDARHYYPVCDCVYRCSGYPYSPDGISINLHDYDENMYAGLLGNGPEFFAEILMTYGTYHD